MSTNEIIAELPRLPPDELVQIRNKVEEVLKGHGRLPEQPETVSDFLLAMAGIADGLPADLAENHDHYLYGAPRRNSA